MDSAGLIVLPRAVDPIDADLREVDVAIALVAQGAAVRVRLVGLPSSAWITPIALAHAQSAGVGFRVEGSGPGAGLVFGPSWASDVERSLSPRA